MEDHPWQINPKPQIIQHIMVPWGLSPHGQTPTIRAMHILSDGEVVEVACSKVDGRWYGVFPGDTVERRCPSGMSFNLDMAWVGSCN